MSRTPTALATFSASAGPRRSTPRCCTHWKRSRQEVLTKLHGTVDAVETLAFADEELTRPLRQERLDALAGAAHGRTVVVYGYAAADADLTDLLVRVFRDASEIVWFEPDEGNRRLIRRAFPDLGGVFDPTDLPSGGDDPFTATEDAFLHFAAERGCRVEPDLAGRFVLTPQRNFPAIPLEHPPGLVYARIIERWGPMGAQRRALWIARTTDLVHLRIGTLKGHLRWTLRRSLYGGHLAPAVVRLLASRPSVLARASATAREYILTRNCALLLGDHQWDRLGAFAEWAIEFRHECGDPPNPSDLYYRSQANRYRMLPVAAHDDATQAEAGLSEDLRAPCRRALRSGQRSDLRGPIQRGAGYAFDLQYRRGRYRFRDGRRGERGSRSSHSAISTASKRQGNSWKRGSHASSTRSDRTRWLISATSSCSMRE